jgi:polyisoprenoid-binding protein YceI
LTKLNLAVALTLSLCAAPAMAQTSPNRSNASAVIQAGRYKVDPDHTQVVWSVDHLGFSRLYGMVGGMSGTLTLDPAHLTAAELQVNIQLSSLMVTSAELATHLQTADFFDVTKFPNARYVSRTIAVQGEEATITGDLTLRGQTRPVVLHARFYGAGTDPMTQAQTVGFSAKAQIKRSDFGLGFGAPLVSDMVDLEITAAFAKTPG